MSIPSYADITDNIETHYLQFTKKKLVLIHFCVLTTILRESGALSSEKIEH